MQYECENSGSTVYRGRTIRYKEGVEEYEPGSLDHVGSCRAVTGSRKAVVNASQTRGVTTVEPKPLDGTKKEIKKWLDDHDVDYDSGALKAELLETLEDA